jgi:hypothetical protein
MLGWAGLTIPGYQNVLYLMVVNMPTTEELSAASHLTGDPHPAEEN